MFDNSQKSKTEFNYAISQTKTVHELFMGLGRNGWKIDDDYEWDGARVFCFHQLKATQIKRE